MSLAHDINALISNRSLYGILYDVRAFLMPKNGSNQVVARRGDEYVLIIMKPGYDYNSPTNQSIVDVVDAQMGFRRGEPYWTPANVRAL